MSDNCFCHLNGFAVKDATARKDIENTNKNVDAINNSIQTINNSIASTNKNVEELDKSVEALDKSVKSVSDAVSNLDTEKELPKIYVSDNGKVLTAQNGEWVAKAIPNTDSGNSNLPVVSGSDDGKYLIVENGEWVAKDFTIADDYMIGDADGGQYIRDEALLRIVRGELPLLLVVNPTDYDNRKIIKLQNANHIGSGETYNFIGFETDSTNCKINVYEVIIQTSDGYWVQNTHEIQLPDGGGDAGELPCLITGTMGNFDVAVYNELVNGTKEFLYVTDEGKMVKLYRSGGELNNDTFIYFTGALMDESTNSPTIYQVKLYDDNVWILNKITVEIPTKTSQLTNDSGFLTQHQSLSGYAKTANHYTKTESDNKYQTKGNYLTSVPSEYVTETELTNKGYAVKSSAETWTFTLSDGSTVTKKVVLA